MGTGERHCTTSSGSPVDDNSARNAGDDRRVKHVTQFNGVAEGRTDSHPSELTCESTN